MSLVRFFSEIKLSDLPLVGGKNASLGEMYSTLSSKGVAVPDGFAVTAQGYWQFMEYNQLLPVFSSLLDELNTETFGNLSEVASKIRALIMKAEFPSSLEKEISDAFEILSKECGAGVSFAVRSSATAEDLPHASFAGQQESFLNVKGRQNLIKACHRCYASLFTARAIKYRSDNGFDHMKVALSIGVQKMVRSDQSCSGVMFTIDPDSGFQEVVLVSGAWGLGENVVQGTVNTDEFLVYKPFLGQVKNPVISHKLGSKAKTMVFSDLSETDIATPEEAVRNTDTPIEKRQQYILNDEEIIQLAQWACILENHYKTPMDIEWAKDSLDGKLYIVQARPETVHSQKKEDLYKQYTLLEKGKALCSGAGLGHKIVSGKARRLHSPSEISEFNEGEILVAEKTDPDWDPILKKAAAIITDQGGRTSHAAIVAREVGAIAVVGTGNGTQVIRDQQVITVSTATGHTGIVYDGELKWEEKSIDISQIPKNRTKAMLIMAHPDEAYHYAQLPSEGVGLMRMEFIINTSIGIHPMALKHFERLDDEQIKSKIEDITHMHRNKEDYFIHQLAEATAKIAAAFYPREVIVRMSDFKSNEYAHLLGGSSFEPHEENPMIGFRGASRYYHPLYREAFEMECQAMKRVREDMGFTNIKLMIPFCRTLAEAQKVLTVMSDLGLKRGHKGLDIYMMVEIPSNALLAEEFATLFDGFSIGSNDLTQLTLGADRDSELLSDIFSPFDPAVMQLIEMTLVKAAKSQTPTGLCGQAPSDYPEFARFLVQNGINSISFNPDALIRGIENIAEAEKELKH